MKKADEKLKDGGIVLLHCGYWLMYLLLLTVIFALAGQQLRTGESMPLWLIVPLMTICIVPNVFTFYLSYGVLFGRFLKPRRFVAIAIAAILSCVVAAALGIVLAVAFFGWKQPILADWAEFSTLFGGLFLIAAVHSVIALIIRGFVAWFDELKAGEELARRNFETEIELVKSQINPHFLFNTLNNIDVLIGRDAALASDYLNKLSDILRFMVYESGAEKIPLRRELEYLENYLNLQKIRTSNPDYVKFEVRGDTKTLEIAPLILFPFVENAFKHTENIKNSATIAIAATIDGDRFVFECENPYKTGAPKDVGGLGNELIQRRLELVYPERHSLSVEDSGKVHRIVLSLDLSYDV